MNCGSGKMKMRLRETKAPSKVEGVDEAARGARIATSTTLRQLMPARGSIGTFYT